MLKFSLLTILTALTLTAGFAHAQDADDFTLAAKSCRARAIDRFYCPWFGGTQWQGPYFDNGCSVKCAQGQRAICQEASCDSRQNGQPIESACYCK